MSQKNQSPIHVVAVETSLSAGCDLQFKGHIGFFMIHGQWGSREIRKLLVTLDQLIDIRVKYWHSMPDVVCLVSDLSSSVT